jgi:hypothetical protein
MYTSPRKEDLKANAALIRSKYLGKPMGTSNVAIAEIYLNGNISFCVGATSRGGRKTPTPQPIPDTSDNLDEPLDFTNIFSEDNKIASFQVVYEALDVYKNAVKVLDPNQSLEALLNILDDCLEGYAIFPGSQGRRELFNWWLLEVVPASWSLSVPRYMYRGNDSGEERGIMSNLNSKKIFPQNILPYSSLKSFQINVKTQNQSAFNSIEWK